MQNGENMKKAVNWIGRILMVLVIIVIMKKLWGYRESIVIELTPKLFVQIGLGCILCALTVYMCPFVYKNVLYITTGKKLGYVKVAATYCKSNVLKYLPGNVMQYVGRNELAVKEDMSHGQVALATFLEIGITFASAVLVSIVFSWSYAVEWVSKYVHVNLGIVLLLIIGGIVLSIIIFKFFGNQILNYVKEILTWKNIVIIILMVLYFSFFSILNGLLYYYILSLIGIYLEFKYYVIGIGLCSMSFVLGYVTPGVPGGIGIREAVLVYFFSSFMQESQLLMGTLLFRLVSIIGDFVALGIALIMEKLKNPMADKK